MNDRLDIKTPRGQATKIQELEAYFIFERRYTGFKIKHTDKDEPERFDGWIMRDGKKRALVETKCRYDKNYYEFTSVSTIYFLNAAPYPQPHTRYPFPRA